MRLPTLLFALLGLGLLAPASQAAGGTPESMLPWPKKNEVLAYHSCGCADACWVAEVRQRSSKAVRARLHCDCEKLSYWSAASADEEVIGATCAAINDQPDKFELIPRLMLEKDQPRPSITR